MRQACTMRSCQRFRLDEVQRDTSSTLLSVEYSPSITGPAVLAGIAAPLVAASRALGCSKVCGLYAARAALVRNCFALLCFYCNKPLHDAPLLDGIAVTSEG